MGYESYDSFSKTNPQTEIISRFEPSQQVEIRQKLQILSSIGYFIGKDFQIPVELGEPGSGWSWNFKDNIIRTDPIDLIKKPMDYLRYLISHEAGHRRVSRTDFIPKEIWEQPGFSSMMNFIEDPRVDNFVAEAYPRFRDQLNINYQSLINTQDKVEQKAKADLGTLPRFVRAGLEYIKHWYRETSGTTTQVPIEDQDISEDIKSVITKTIDSARDSWLRYPSREEANKDEGLIEQYAKVSYEINRDEIWPEFKKLVDQDVEDQKLEEFLKENKTDGDGSGRQDLPQDLKKKLSDEEQRQLEEALKLEEAEPSEENSSQNSDSVDLDSLSEELKQKIKDYIDSLPDDVKEELLKKAIQSINDFEKKFNEELEGKLSDNPEKKSDSDSEDLSSDKREPDHDSEKKESETLSPDKTLPESESTKKKQVKSEDLRKFEEFIQQILKSEENSYEKIRSQVLPLIDNLENDLREIFVERRAHKWETGYKSGRRIDIKKRIQEKAKALPVVESKSWQKRELPQEKDYAISLLVDLSGSMREGKIEETFKGVVVLTEVLNRLSINIEILGFNSELYEYQKFKQNSSQQMRDHMTNMLSEVDSSAAGNTDAGWALKQASERLMCQKEAEKFLIILTDGKPSESFDHSGPKYDLKKIITGIIKETDQKLVGLGIGEGTGHVEEYYPNSIANIRVEEMSDKLAGVIRDAIANYNSF